MKKLFLPALLILIPTAAAAADQGDATASATDAAKPKPRKICREEARTGTKFTTRTCKTQDEWDAEAAKAVVPMFPGVGIPRAVHMVYQMMFFIITPALICGATCTEQVDAGTSVTLTAIADASSVFTGWTGCTSSGGLNGTTCIVSMSSDQQATFIVGKPAE